MIRCAGVNVDTPCSPDRSPSRRLLVLTGLIISRLGPHPHPPAHSATGQSGSWPVSLIAAAGQSDSTRSSWVRDSMPSLMKTFFRQYWTVRALRNNRAPISGLDRPCDGQEASSPAPRQMIRLHQHSSLSHQSGQPGQGFAALSKSRDTRVSKLCVGVTANANDPSRIVQRPIVREP